MLSSGAKNAIRMVIVIMLVVESIMQLKIDPQRHQFEPMNTDNVNAAAQGLPIEFALGAVVGFREAVAGLLWVRCDEFFDNGDFEAITPLVRIITWLDPHQTEVYQTGAWHMDYNFTDSGNRSDRRYVPLAIALMKEGVENNPDEPGMPGELAFTHFYRKVGDYVAARIWFEKGQEQTISLMRNAEQHPDNLQYRALAQFASNGIITDSHGLAHAFEQTGDYKDAIAQWQTTIQLHEENIRQHYSTSQGESEGLNVANSNLKEDMLRAKWRAQLPKQPWDMQFTCSLIRKAPKIFAYEGTMNVIGAQKWVMESGPPTWGPVDGCRVEFRLQDQGYTTPVIKSFRLTSLNLDNTTICQDSAIVKKGHFERIVDMSQDPDMYSFKAPRYTVTLWWNPVSSDDTPLNVRDRVGWLGEGMTDKHYLDTSGMLPGDVTNKIDGLRYIKKTFTLTRDDILGTGEKVFN